VVIVRIALVAKQIEQICKTSQQVKHLIRQALETVEANPSAYEPLAKLPKDLADQEGVFLRKIKIVHQKHDYRLVYLHRLGEGWEEVDVFYIRSREDDYRSLDWDVVRSLIGQE
jgi:hypothetical protein